MRIHRIRLRDFKGVGDAEVEFALDGVTIVEGPNEVGKTSLAEALAIVLEQPDSSSKAAVRDARPVHVDAGPWVEVELSTGPYRLIVEKRWYRSPMTHLRVLEPKAEELTGRQAHDRLRAIVGETLDEQLFRALHHYQGVDLKQASLGASTSLAAALDAAASGQALAGEKEASLLDVVHEEWLRYFTPTGRSTAERVSGLDAVRRLEGEVIEAQGDLDELDGMSERHRLLAGRLAELRDDLEMKRVELEREARFWDELQGHKLATAEAKTANVTARAAKVEAKRRVDERAALFDAETTARILKVEAEQEVDKDAPALDAARRAVQSATRRLEAARSALTTAALEEHEARQVEEYLRCVISRGLWSDRLKNARDGQAELAEARRVLGENVMDEARLARIEEASLNVTETKARFAASAATVVVEVHEECDLATGDGISLTLQPGELFQRAVDGELTFELGELARVTVRGNSPERSLRAALEEAEQHLVDLLQDAGLPSNTTVARCRIAAQQRRDAEAHQQQAEKLIADSLRDLTIERLENEVAEDDAFILAFERDHPQSAKPPCSLDEAKSSLEQAEQKRLSAEKEVLLAESELDASRVQHEAIYQEITVRTTALEVARSLEEKAAEALRLARDLESDESLDATLMRCTGDVERTERALAAAEEALVGLDPDSAEARLENLKALTERLSRERSEVETELTTVKTTLAVKGEEGLHDRLDQLESRLARDRHAIARTERAAAAVDLLWQRLTANREKAQRSYVAPYRAEIERLGRIVYGPSFSVEVDHSTLGIESRTLLGRTVDFDQLSTGAQEQLCVIARLACAAIVAGKDGAGAPVIIDDALGWTDRDRLERIGAAFTAASRDCQVIVLTCDPSRYGSVGNAVVRHLYPTTAPA